MTTRRGRAAAGASEARGTGVPTMTIRTAATARSSSVTDDEGGMGLDAIPDGTVYLLDLTRGTRGS